MCPVLLARKTPLSFFDLVACKIMFESLEETQENGMQLINLVLVHLHSFLFLTCVLISSFGAFTVDDICPLDFDSLKANGHGILAFKVADIRSSDNSFLCDKVIWIMLTNWVTDLADVPRIKGMIVLGGSGLHISPPKRRLRRLFRFGSGPLHEDRRSSGA
jgi:hypothetical protein